jgi:hypothetical protein
VRKAFELIASKSSRYLDEHAVGRGSGRAAAHRQNHVRLEGKSRLPQSAASVWLAFLLGLRFGAHLPANIGFSR